jgi:Na+/H+ antiporter NhaD/arsenite permease-like protein
MNWDMHSVLILAVFAAVILLIAFDVVDMMVAGLMGVSLLVLFGVYSRSDMVEVFQTANGAIALLFGGMVVARVLVPTGIFEQIGARFLKLTRGSGRRFLLGIVLLVVPLCAVLPNATTVILLAPIVIRVAQALEIDIVAPLVLMAVLSNSAGLLTLVGDPATFLVGSTIGMSFSTYLERVSLGGLLAVLTIVVLLPWLLKEIWCTRRLLPEHQEIPRLERPWFCASVLLVLIGMVALFVYGDALPNPIVPPAVAIVAASGALLLIYGWRIEPVDRVLHDVDWKTLIFLVCMFCLVVAFGKTGVLQAISQTMYAAFGADLLPVAMGVLGVVGLLSSLLANIPVVAGMLLLVKGYLVAAQVVPEEALGALFGEWPAGTLPVFVAMMYGGTLGGNATLIGASANVVAAGVSARHGQRLTFTRFLRLGLPIALCQLGVSALYVVVMFWLAGR